LELAASIVWTWFKLPLASISWTWWPWELPKNWTWIPLPETSNLLIINPNLQIWIVRKLTNWGFLLCCVKFILVLILAFLVAWKFRQSSIAIAGVLPEYDSPVHFEWAFSIRYVRTWGVFPIDWFPSNLFRGWLKLQAHLGPSIRKRFSQKSPVEIFPMGNMEWAESLIIDRSTTWESYPIVAFTWIKQDFSRDIDILFWAQSSSDYEIASVIANSFCKFKELWDELEVHSCWVLLALELCFDWHWTTTKFALKVSFHVSVVKGNRLGANGERRGEVRRPFIAF